MEKKQTRLVKFTYEVKREEGTKGMKFSLPVSKERYAELATGPRPESKAWTEARDALSTLAGLSGGTLGAWSIELKIENIGGKKNGTSNN